MTRDTTPISDEAITRLIKAFYEAHGVESWESSAEYRYGAEHHWMREAFAEIAPLLVSADSSAQAEPTHYGEAPDGMGWTKHRGLIGECSAPDCADDPDALNARLIAALDASESVVEGLRAELAETTRFKDVLHGIVRTVARIVHRSPNDDGGYLYADVPAMVERELAALRAAGGQEKPQPVSDPYKLLDEVERIVKFEAGPNDVYMRADVLSVIRQVRAAARVGGQAEPSDNGTYLAECQTCQTLREPDPGHPIPRGAASRAMRCDTCEEIRWHRRANGAPAAAVSGEHQDTAKDSQ